MVISHLISKLIYELAIATRQLQKNLIVWNAFWVIDLSSLIFDLVSGQNKQSCKDLINDIASVPTFCGEIFCRNIQNVKRKIILLEFETGYIGEILNFATVLFLICYYCASFIVSCRRKTSKSSSPYWESPGLAFEKRAECIINLINGRERDDGISSDISAP